MFPFLHSICEFLTAQENNYWHILTTRTLNLRVLLLLLHPRIVHHLTLQNVLER